MTDQAFNNAVDTSKGVTLCLCFIIGTLGNLVSFLYFKSRKRDISNVLYMFITATDLVISIAALPKGVSILSDRQAGIIFGNRFGCEAYYYTWNIAIALSVFLVLCLSTTRTISLMRPFQPLKMRYLVFAILAYFLVIVLQMITLSLLSAVAIEFGSYTCVITVTHSDLTAVHEVIFTVISVLNNIEFTVPVFVVVISCVISGAVLKKRNKNVQQRELQQSRNRATVTILLFALLYFICNIQEVITLFLLTLCKFTKNWTYYYDYKQSIRQYSRVFTVLLELETNSALNPVLYFWRMPALREYTMTGMRRILRLMIEIRRPATNAPAAADTRFCNRINENIDVAEGQQPTAAPELLETRF